MLASSNASSSPSADASNETKSTKDSDAPSQAESPSVIVEHDGQTFSIEPLQGDVPVTELYHYQLPMQNVSAENGASDDGGPYYTAAGLEDFRQDDVTITFLYDGPDALSLVVVHDNTGESPHGGGAVTWTITGLPETGRWAVKDDLYRNQTTGELADTNYDNWNVSDGKHVIDWTWDARTDGGAFYGLGDAFHITIDPAFNEEATLYDQYYEGTITDWVLLSNGDSEPETIPLCRLEPLQMKATSNED